MASRTIISRTDHSGVAVLAMNYPGKTVNVVDEALLEDLREHVDAVLSDEGISAVVLTSDKSGSFGVGADIKWLSELLTRPDTSRFLKNVHELMFRIARSPKPFVAAISGYALGGALELALASEAIVATPDALLGLPETSLGLIPGGAGTQFIQRWLTTEGSLDLMLSARPMDGSTAFASGLVSTLVDLETLIDDAVQTAETIVGNEQRRRWRVDGIEEARRSLAQHRERAGAPTSAAVTKILDVVEVGFDGGPVAGCDAERNAFLELLASTESIALRHLYLAERHIRRRGRANGDAFKTLAVVGAGQMGAGIAATAVRQGMNVRLRDIESQRLDEAQVTLAKILTRESLDQHSVKERQSHLVTTLDWQGFADADVVIEAVFELPDLKSETLRAVCDLVTPKTLIGTNTSAIPIHKLASSVTHPDRFLGTHFFSPVDRMPFVELIPHSGTSMDSIRRAHELAVQMGKICIVVADKPGFFTSRIYARWLIEGLRLLLEGFPVDTIDAAAVAAGFPIGPMQAHDEAGLDLIIKASILQVALPVMSARLDVETARTALERLTESGVGGRRLGRGFYEYHEGRRMAPNPEIRTILSTTDSSPGEAKIGERLLLAFATESFLCWDDGTLSHPDDGDVAAVVAIGFPRRLGGPFHWADSIGIKQVAAMCRNDRSGVLTASLEMSQFAHSKATFAGAQRRTLPATFEASLEGAK